MRKIHCNVIACADLQFQVFLLVHTEWYCTLALLEKTKKKRQKIVINVLMFLNLFLKYTQVTFEWCTCNISTAHRKGDLANIVRKGVRMLSAICHIGVPSQAITCNQQKKKKKSCSIPLIQELHFKQFDLKETHCTRKTTSRNSHKTIPHWSMPTWNGDKTRSSEGPLRVSLIEA